MPTKASTVKIIARRCCSMPEVCCRCILLSSMFGYSCLARGLRLRRLQAKGVPRFGEVATASRPGKIFRYFGGLTTIYVTWLPCVVG